MSHNAHRQVPELLWVLAAGLVLTVVWWAVQQFALDNPSADADTSGVTGPAVNDVE